MADVILNEVSLERMVRAVEKVRDRLMRAARALDAAGVPYAVAGGNAAAAWVSRVDEAAVRNSQDVDILIRRTDPERAVMAMSTAGFVYRHAASVDMFLDGPNAKARDAVRVVFAQEKVRQDHDLPTPGKRACRPFPFAQSRCPGAHEAHIISGQRSHAPPGHARCRTD